MYLIYIDDSRDGPNLPGDPVCVFSGLAVPVHRWREVFEEIKRFRRQLKADYGIKLSAELHATEFVAGRGRPSDRILAKSERFALYEVTLRMVTKLPGVRLFNTLAPLKKEYWAFERLVNRINRNMEARQTHAMLLCDQGKDTIYTRMVRKMGVYNPIPSNRGSWAGERRNIRNIPIRRIVEDPVFKDSRKSYFIQLVDFCAFALLRREHPMESQRRFGLDKSFRILAESDILVREASRTDPDGIVRI